MAHNESKSLGGFFSVRMIAENSIIAALYVVLTLLVPALSYDYMQCRFSEALVLLVFWRPDLVVGLTLGCFISNVIGASLALNVWIDVLLGTLATFISCLLISFFSKRLFIGWIWPVIFNGFIVGSELYFLGYLGDLPIWAGWLWVALGETIAMAIGYALWVSLAHTKVFNKAFRPLIHEDVKW